MEKLKKYLPDLLVVLLFAVIAFAYFMPADLEGRILYQHDTSAGRGAGQEALEYLQKTGERTRWTNSTFSGMPTYQTSPSYESTDLLTKVVSRNHLIFPVEVRVYVVFVILADLVQKNAVVIVLCPDGEDFDLLFQLRIFS